MIKKRLIIISVSLIIVLSGCASKGSKDDQNTEVIKQELMPKEKICEYLTIEEISKGVYVADHAFPWPSNSLVVEMENGTVLLVDTPYTPEATGELLDWIKENIGERDYYCINTGFHFDNLGGNKVLIDEKIAVYGSTLTRDLINERGEDSRKLMMSWLTASKDKVFYDAYQTIPYVAPTELFELKEGDKDITQVLSFGEEKVEVYYPGPSHSPDNLTVYFPERKLLFGGCMIKSLDSPDLGNTADADLKEWPVSVERMYEKYKDAEIVIPGHDAWGTIDLIKHTLELCKKKNG